MGRCSAVTCPSPLRCSARSTVGAGEGDGNPLPERTIFKQGALASHHRTPSTAAAPVIITLGVAGKALASARHGKVGWGPSS